MQRILVTPEIPVHFRRILRTLTLFDKSELIIISEKQGKVYSTDEVIQQIVEFAPSLVITQKEGIAKFCTNIFGCCKVVLLTDCQPSCDRIFLSNALDLDAFIASTAKIFKM